MTHENKDDFVNSGPDHNAKCDKGLDDQKKLKSHIRRKCGDRKYECSKCTKVLTSSRGLAYHIKRYHKTDNDRFWPCTICGKLFTEWYIMTRQKLHIILRSSLNVISALLLSLVKYILRNINKGMQRITVIFVLNVVLDFTRRKSLGIIRPNILGRKVIAAQYVAPCFLTEVVYASTWQNTQA